MATDVSGAQPSRTGGIDRRRVLQGAAWAAPLIVLAAAAPAAAASGGGPAGDITVHTAQARYASSYWSGTENIKATAFQLGMQYTTPTAPVAALTSYEVEFTVKDVKNPQSPLWGFDSTQGNSAEWLLVSTTVSANDVTFRFAYQVLPVALYGSPQMRFFVEVPNNSSGDTLQYTVYAETGAGTPVTYGPVTVAIR